MEVLGVFGVWQFTSTKAFSFTAKTKARGDTSAAPLPDTKSARISHWMVLPPPSTVPGLRQTLVNPCQEYTILFLHQGGAAGIHRRWDLKDGSHREVERWPWHWDTELQREDMMGFKQVMGILPNRCITMSRENFSFGQRQGKESPSALNCRDGGTWSSCQPLSFPFMCSISYGTAQALKAHFLSLPIFNGFNGALKPACLHSLVFICCDYFYTDFVEI